MPSLPIPSVDTPRRGARSNLRGGTVRSLLALILAGAALLATAAPSAPPGSATRVEKRIEDMHAKLHIDAAQEPLWLTVAQTMRDNQLALEPLIAERAKNSTSASALQDLDSFAAVSEAHSGGIRRFIAAFEPLYAAMTPAQKKDADALFRSGPAKMASSK